MDPEHHEYTPFDTFYYYYNFFLMTTKGRAIFGAVVVAVGGAFVFHKYQNDEKHSYRVIKDLSQKSYPKDHDENYQKLLREIRFEKERKEALQREAEERNERIRRRMAEKRATFQQAIQEMGVIDREDNMIFAKKQMESEERLRKLQDQHRMKQIIKDATASFENNQLKSQGMRELEAIQAKRSRSQKIYQRNAERMDEHFEENRQNYQKQDVGRREELQQQQERAEQRRREIEEQLEKDLEELRRRDQERREQMDEQLHHIRRILRMKVWNEIIESNWTKRLNALRSSHREVEKSYSQMKRLRNQDGSLSENQIRNVLVAVSQQKALMETEKQEMDRMYSEHGKTFLLEIKDSVDDVSAECDRLTYVLKNEPSNTRRIEDCFSALSRVTMSIPSLAELKAKHRETMQ